jgi:chemotaxis response regulator CheB
MATHDTKTKVYLVDDSLTIRALMEMLISRDANLQICGTAANAEIALEEIETFFPDIVLLDLNLPGMDGLAFLDVLRDHWHATAVIIVSSAAKQGSAVCDLAFNRGAIACFDKSKMVQEADKLISLLEDVGDGTLSAHLHQSAAITLPPPPSNRDKSMPALMTRIDMLPLAAPGKLN